MNVLPNSSASTPQQMPLALLEPSVKPHQSNRRADALVQCKGFRCAAYLDENGVWRSPADGKQLEVLAVLTRL